MLFPRGLLCRWPAVEPVSFVVDNLQSVGPDFCAVPENCQRDFGHCDSDHVPYGPSSWPWEHPPRKKAIFRQTEYQCSKPNTIALTFDDGPSENTSELLDILKEANATATFFITGINNAKGEIDLHRRWILVVERMIREGHQIASHTWSHPNLDAMTSEQRKDEMYKNEQAIANIIFKAPTYMRAPYLKCSTSSGCLTDMIDLGYRVVDWSVNSRDAELPDDLDAMKYAIDAGFAAAPPEGRSIVIQHDTLRQSAMQLTSYILQKAEERGWKPVTVAECLYDTSEAAYRTIASAEMIPVSP